MGESFVQLKSKLDIPSEVCWGYLCNIYPMLLELVCVCHKYLSEEEMLLLLSEEGELFTQPSLPVKY